MMNDITVFLSYMSFLSELLVSKRQVKPFQNYFYHSGEVSKVVHLRMQESLYFKNNFLGFWSPKECVVECTVHWMCDYFRGGSLLCRQGPNRPTGVRVKSVGGMDI